MKLSSVHSWHYQLQGTVDPEISADCFVIDIDADPTPLLRPDRIVLAYFSVGEAEDYRAYWPEAEDIVLGENPEWTGNYPVRFWSYEWNRIVQTSVREARKKGFNGLYLDKVDVVDDIARRWPRLAREVSLYPEMSVLISRIVGTAPELLIVLQNGEDLIAEVGTSWCIDGLAKEELLFQDGKRNPPDEVRETLTKLRLSNVPVLCVEYLDDPAQRQTAIDWFDARGLPLFLSSGDRELAG